jgi:hypothetical protein
MAQEGDLLARGLHQGNPEVRASDLQGKPGESRPAADVRYPQRSFMGKGSGEGQRRQEVMDRYFRFFL